MYTRALSISVSYKMAYIQEKSEQRTLFPLISSLWLCDLSKNVNLASICERYKCHTYLFSSAPISLTSEILLDSMSMYLMFHFKQIFDLIAFKWVELKCQMSNDKLWMIAELFPLQFMFMELFFYCSTRIAEILFTKSL